MKCYEITPESAAYEVAVRKFNIRKTWDKAMPALKELLGANPVSVGLRLTADALVLDQEPAGLEKQFKNSKFGRTSRSKSEIHKKFKGIVEEYGLYGDWDCRIDYALGTCWHRGHEAHYPPIEGKYYIKTERTIENMTGLREIKEAELLKLWAAELERRETA